MIQEGGTQLCEGGVGTEIAIGKMQAIGDLQHGVSMPRKFGESVAHRGMWEEWGV